MYVPVKLSSGVGAEVMGALSHLLDAAAEVLLDLRWRVTHPEFWAAHGGGALAQALVHDDFFGRKVLHRELHLLERLHFELVTKSPFDWVALFSGSAGKDVAVGVGPRWRCSAGGGSSGQRVTRRRGFVVGFVCA